MSVSFDPADPVVPASGTPPATGIDTRGRSIARRAAEEAQRYLGFVAYLCVVFGTLILFSLNVYSKIDGEVPHYPGYHFYALGLINALVFAKILLVAEAANVGGRFIGRRLREGPLVYPILYRSVLFSAVLILAYVLEEVLVGAWHGKTTAEVLPEVGGGPRGLASFGWIMFVALIPYFTYREIGRVLGETALRALLLTRRPAPKASSGEPCPSPGPSI
jgi:hypothetical protein